MPARRRRASPVRRCTRRAPRLRSAAAVDAGAGRATSQPGVARTPSTTSPTIGQSVADGPVGGSGRGTPVGSTPGRDAEPEHERRTRTRRAVDCASRAAAGTSGMRRRRHRATRSVTTTRNGTIAARRQAPAPSRERSDRRGRGCAELPRTSSAPPSSDARSSVCAALRAGRTAPRRASRDRRSRRCPAVVGGRQPERGHAGAEQRTPDRRSRTAGRGRPADGARSAGRVGGESAPRPARSLYERARERASGSRSPASSSRGRCRAGEAVEHDGREDPAAEALATGEPGRRPTPPYAPPSAERKTSVCCGCARPAAVPAAA